MTKYFIFIVSIIFSNLSFAQEIPIEVFLDTSNTYSIEDTSMMSFAEDSLIRLHYFDTDKTNWVRIKIPSWAKNHVISTENNCDTMEVYHYLNNAWRLERCGTYSKRYQKSHYAHFTFDVRPNETLYLRVRNKYPLKAQVHLVDKITFGKENVDFSFFLGIYFGAIFIAIIYNLLLVYSTRRKIYIYYVGYVISISFLYAILTGFAQVYLYPNYPNLMSDYTAVPAVLGLMFILAFCSEYLRLRENSVKNYRFINILIILYGITLFVLLIVRDESLSSLTIRMLNAIVSLYLIILGYYRLLFKRQKEAALYVVAWTFFLIGTILYILQLDHIIEPNFISKNGIFIGSAIEIMIFSISLSRQVNKYKRAGEIARKSELKQLRINQELITNQKKELEHKVAERTIKLKDTVEELNQINHELSSSMDTITAQNKEITKMHQKVTASINYAKRIQDALLPFRKNISKSLAHYFILFMPRDIVSGDFYWFSDEIKDRIIIVQADCTGHGVPGAFMSLIGINLLEEIVNRQTISTPSMVLQRMDRLLKKLLSQSASHITDGMDMSIICLHKNTRKIEFAGAKNPIYLVENHTIKKIRASRFSIGRNKYQKQEKIFDNHVITPQKTICLYQVTDGYPDQFGGVRRQKYGTKQLKRKLLDAHTHPMEDQAQILSENIYEWMRQGKERQIDDISILGFKY